MEKELEKRILVVDIYYLPLEYKEKNIEEIKQDLESKYGYQIFFIDSSRKNLQGISNSNLPAYFI